MPSTYTARLRLELQAAGENRNTGGAPKLNNVISRIDYAIAGRTILALGASSTYLLASSNGDDEARAAILDITTLTTPCTITVPAVSKAYLVRNQGAAPATLTTGSGAAVTVGPGATVQAFCDGVGVSELGYGGYGLKDYIDQAALSATGALPAAAGNAGKHLVCDGVSWLPRAPVTTDLADLSTYTAQRNAFALVMSLIF
jgi:hypothetical protein